jgi:glycosyltransferase involved in cell wall biosynthesis
MRVQVVTSLFPSPPRPFEGVFAERRWHSMLQRGHDVSVLHPQPHAPFPFLGGKWAEIHAMPKKEERSGLEVERPRYVHLPGRAIGNAMRFARTAIGALRSGVDVVVCDYAWPAAMLAPALAQRGIPCVVSGRGSDVLQVAGEAGLAAPLGRCLRAASGWCGVSQDLVTALDELGGAPGRGYLVPNGVDVELFRPSSRSAARETLGLAADGPLVLVVGHLIERKDPLLALGVFAGGAPAAARLVFIGSGPLEEQLRERARALGVESRVSFAGERTPSELAAWYAACDALLLTSRREGRPNVVLEAFASGRPVLATEAGGTAELVHDQRMMARTRVEGTLGTMLGALLEAPPAEAELLARVEGLSWNASAFALESCLADACARGADAG